MNASRWRYLPELRLCILAAGLLAAGILVYVFAREAPVYFLPASISGFTTADLPALISGPLPTFVHTTAMILITAAALWPWPQLLLVNCVSWLAIECLFELGQLPEVGEHLDAVLGEASLTDFFGGGTFDPLDMAAALLGAFTAYLLIRHISRGTEP